MFKKLFLLGLFALQSWAVSSLELAKNLVNDPSKNAQLELLFASDNYKDSNANVNLESLVRVLKTNSLLNLTLDSSRALSFNFKAKTDGVLFFKIINDALNEAGYVYFIPTDLSLKDGEIEYQVQVESKYILDPATLYRLLRTSFVGISNVRKISNLAYEYELDFSRAKLKTNQSVQLNSPKNLEKPFKDYTLNLQNAKSIIIEANPADAWYPKILFLDKNLNLIKSIRQNEKTQVINEHIPNAAVYAIISDLFSLDNIRRGLRITLK